MSFNPQILLVCIMIACGFLWATHRPNSHPSDFRPKVADKEVEATGLAQKEEPRVGIASWYGDELKGRPTASGEPFDPTGLTAASWHHPIDSIVEVTRPDNGRSVRVRINDRGPAHRLNRLIDLSHASFKKIAHPDIGLVEVEVQLVALPRSARQPEFAQTR